MHRKWGRFEGKAVNEAFNLINEEICQFNNDLNQISHELHPVIVGEIHLLAIYLMWKKEVDMNIEKQNEPYIKKQSNREI